MPGGQVAEGRQVVEQLERLKVPDESKMGASELSCWRENKKTITNSLKTLSRWQIVSDLPQSALLESDLIVLRLFLPAVVEQPDLFCNNTYLV